MDEVLVQAYLGVTQRKSIDGESEQAYGRRLYKADIRAGNVISVEDLTTFFNKGLPEWVQTGIQNSVAPGFSYDRVVRLAHNFGASLRQADVGEGTPRNKLVSGVKPIAVKVLRAAPARVFHAEANGSGDDSDHAPRGGMSFKLKDLEVALGNVRVNGKLPVSAKLGESTPTWQMTPPSRSLPLLSFLYRPGAGRVRPGPSEPNPLSPEWAVYPVREYGVRPCATSATSWDTGWPIVPPYSMSSGELRGRIVTPT
jgi:hypothetical protein